MAVAKCEAPRHVGSCNRIGETRDHFTPRSIGKALKWTHIEINSPDNIQYLSEKCHRVKDETTIYELQNVLHHGGAKTIWQHHNELLAIRYGRPKT